AKVGLGELFCDQSVKQIEDRGGRVRIGTPAKSIRFEGDRVTGVELEDGSVLKSDAYIVALDPKSLEKVTSDELRLHAGVKRVEKFESCPYLSVYLWFDREITERAFWAR